MAEFDALPEYFIPLDPIPGYEGWKAVHVRHGPGAKTKFHWELENPDLQRVRRPDGKHGLPPEVLRQLPMYAAGGKPVADTVERAKEGIRDSRNTPLFVCEGERDVETLGKLGKLAVCSPHGGTKTNDLGKKWPPRYTEQLRGLKVTVIADHDETGLPFAAHVAAQLGARTRCPPGVGEDITDHVVKWIKRGKARDTWWIELLTELPSYTEQQARKAGVPVGSDAWGDSGEVGRDDELDALAHRPVRGFNDTAYAEGFSRRVGHRLRYDHHQGRWLHLEKHHWAPDEDGTTARMMRWYVKQRYAAALRTGDDDTIAAAKSFLGHGRQNTVLNAAMSIRPLADLGADWDSTTYLLGVGNGVVDLQGRTLRDGHPDDRITLWTDVPYVPTAKCDRFERFLAEVFAKPNGEPDPELVDYIKLALGYSITGDTSAQKLFLCRGTAHGANGKSTMFRVLKAVGQLFVVTLPFAVVAGIGNQRFREPAYELANLPGRRLALCSETAEGSWFKTERIKALTGQEEIPVRAIYGHPFWVQPQAKFWLAVNKAPAAPKDDDAFFRRLVVFPFDHEFEIDPSLDDELKAEDEGILRLLIDNAFRWYQTRTLEQLPMRVEHAISAYRRGLDGLDDYFEERVVMDPNGSIDRGDFRRDYDQWCADNGVDPIKGWTKALEGRGLKLTTRAEGEKRPQTWTGATLKKRDDDVLRIAGRG